MGIILLAAFLAGCKQTENPSTGGQEQGIPVTVSKVLTSSGERTLKYSGTVEASQTIPLFFQSTGIVEKVLVETGDEVKKGQLLASVDQSDVRNILSMTESKYQQAKDAYDRLKKVHDQGSLPDIKWVEMETNLEQARSSLELAKSNLEKCFLRAPADGVIGRRNIEPGQLPLTAGVTPFELIDIDRVGVVISVPENEISRMRKGMRSLITVAALDGRQFEGVVTRVSPVADRFSRTYEVEFEVSNPKHELRPGMVCDVAVVLKEDATILLVPYQSVLRDDAGGGWIFAVDSNSSQVARIAVKTGNFRGNLLEIREGVAAGQLVVKDGKEKLSDKSLVDIRHE